MSDEIHNLASSLYSSISFNDISSDIQTIFDNLTYLTNVHNHHNIVFINAQSLLNKHKLTTLRYALSTEHLHNIVIVSDTRLTSKIDNSHLNSARTHNLHRMDHHKTGILIYVLICLESYYVYRSSAHSSICV